MVQTGVVGVGVGEDFADTDHRELGGLVLREYLLSVERRLIFDIQRIVQTRGHETSHQEKRGNTI